jgi:hypothetical protein
LPPNDFGVFILFSSGRICTDRHKFITGRFVQTARITSVHFCGNSP